MSRETEDRTRRNRIGWDESQRVTLGVDADACRRIMEEWFGRKAPVPMTIRKAKTKGLYAITMDVSAKEEEGLLFACWCIRMIPQIMVDVKSLPPHG